MLSITEAGARLRDGSCSSEELTRECLNRIERLNPTLNAYITIDAGGSNRRCKEGRSATQGAMAGEARCRGSPWPSRTTSIPRICGRRLPVACSKNRIPTQDAVVVSRLRAAGAVILGKTNMHEIAIGTTSAISFFGAVRNPHDSTRVTGGFSGGSAAAVAAGLCMGLSEPIPAARSVSPPRLVASSDSNPRTGWSTPRG